MLKALSDNVEENISSSLMTECKYIAECYEGEFVSAFCETGLNFSGSISAIETASMTNDVGSNISQLYILLRIV